MRFEQLLSGKSKAPPAPLSEDALSTELISCEPVRRLSLVLRKLGESRFLHLPQDELFLAEQVVYMAEHDEAYIPSPLLGSAISYITAKCEIALLRQSLLVNARDAG